MFQQTSIVVCHMHIIYTVWLIKTDDAYKVSVADKHGS